MSMLEQMDPAELGERLRIARTNAGKTQESVANELGIARTTLVAIERGQRKLKPEELQRLAGLYSVPVNQLLRPSAIHVDMTARFRKIDQVADAGGPAMEAVGLLNKLASGALELERLVGRPQSQNFPPEQPICPGDVVQQAEDAAMALRQRLGMGLAPISDLVSLLELEIGIRVFARPLHNSISGLFAYTPEVGACILLNARHPRERRALTAAHELGHFMSTRSEPDVIELDEHVSSREERFAVAFSVALMMPSAAMRRRFMDICAEAKGFAARHLIMMSHEFHVSPEALCRRLEGLGLLPGGTYDSIREKGFSRESVRQVLGDAAEDVPSILPPRLSLIAAEAYERGLVTEGQLCEKLCMDYLQVRQMLDSFDVEEANR